MTFLSRTRRQSYRVGRLLGDADAVIHPSKAPRRIVNKVIGRKLVSRIWR